MDFSPEQIASLVASLLVLAILIVGLRRQRAWDREQKRLRDTQRPRPPVEKTPPEDRGGPWG